MNLEQRMVRQKNGIDALSRATGWQWEGDGLSFDGYDAQGNKIASVLTAGLDGNTIGALVNCRGRIYSKSGSFGVVLKFLKSKAQEGDAP